MSNDQNYSEVFPTLAIIGIITSVILLILTPYFFNLGIATLAMSSSGKGLVPFLMLASPLIAVISLISIIVLWRSGNLKTANKIGIFPIVLILLFVIMLAM